MADLTALLSLRPTRRSAMAVLFLAFLLWAAYQTEVGWLYVLAALDLALLGLGAALAWRGLTGVQVQSRHPETVFEGEPLPFTFTVHAGARALRSPLELEVSARRRRLTRHQRIVLWSLAAGEEARPQATLQLPRFGRYAIAAPRLAVTDPQGFFRCARRPGPGTTALVYPPVNCLAPRLQMALAGAELDGPLHRSADPSLFSATRPYTAGDPRRHIHWRSLARFGSLAVKQFEDPSNRDLLLLLDNTRGTSGNLDEMIRIAAALVWAARGRREVCLALPGEPMARAASGGPWPLLAILAELEESPLPAAGLSTWLQDLLRTQSGGDAVLLLPSPTADRLAALERLPLRDPLTVLAPRLEGAQPDPRNRLIRWVILGATGPASLPSQGRDRGRGDAVCA